MKLCATMLLLAASAVFGQTNDVTCAKQSPLDAVRDLQEKMRKNYPPDLKTLVTSAEDLFTKGQVNAAIQALKPEVAKQPERLALIVPYADLLLRARRDLESLAEFQQALRVETDPAYAAHLYSQLALVQRRVGRAREAIVSYERAKQLSGGNVRYSMFLAIELEDSGQQDRAVAEYESILACDPNDPTALSGLAQSLATIGFDLDRAADYAERAWKTFQAPRFRLVLGNVYLKQGRSEAAFKVLRAAYLNGGANADPGYRVLLAQALKGMGASADQDQELVELLQLEYTAQNDRRIRALLAAK